MLPLGFRGTSWLALLAALFVAALLAMGWLHAVGKTPSGPAQRVTLTAQAQSALSEHDALAAAPRRAAVDAAQDAWLTPDLGLDIETLIFEEIGEGSFAQDPAALKQRLVARLKAQYPPEYAARMQGLVERYVDYRVALSQIKAQGDMQDPRALRQSLLARQQLRRRFFDGPEYAALFGAQDRLDHYTVQRLELMRQQSLSEDERRAALQELEAIFSPQERALRAQALQPLAVGEQTARYEAQGTSDAQRFAQRSAQFGRPAAQRLAQLDQEQRQWQQRLQQYAQAQSSQQSGHMTPGELQSLREQMFSPQEQLRLPGALHGLQERASGQTAMP